MAVYSGKMVMQISRKRKLVANGISKADWMSFSHRSQLQMSTLEVKSDWVRNHHFRTRIQNGLSEMGQWIRELIEVVQKWFVYLSLSRT